MFVEFFRIIWPIIYMFLYVSIFLLFARSVVVDDFIQPNSLIVPLLILITSNVYLIFKDRRRRKAIEKTEKEQDEKAIVEIGLIAGYIENNEWDKIIELCMNLIEERPHRYHGNYYYFLSWSYFEKEDFKAGYYYKEILDKYAINTESVDTFKEQNTHLNAMSDYFEGRFEESLMKFEETSEEETAQWIKLRYKFIKAQIHEKIGNIDRQIENLEYVVEYGGRLIISKLAYEKLLMLADNENVDSNIIELEKILYDDLDPERYIEEASAFISTIKLTDFLKYHHMRKLVTAYLYNGKTDKAVKLLEELLSIAKPEKLEGLYGDLAIRHLVVGNTEKAYKYRKLHEENSKDDNPYMSARFLFAEGKYTESLSIWKKINNKNLPLDTRIHLHYRLAEIYEKLGDIENQKTHLQYVAENGKKLYAAKMAREMLIELEGDA